MADRRMHSRSLGGSRKWAALKSDTHRMMYERFLDLTDAYGNFDADPIWLKGQALTRLDVTADAVAAALDDMESVGLITRWEVDGAPYAHIEKFEEHNNTDPAREAQTTIPLPDGSIPKRPPRKAAKSPDGSGGVQDEPATHSDPGPDELRRNAGVGHDLVVTTSGPSHVEKKGIEVEGEEKGNAARLGPPPPPAHASPPPSDHVSSEERFQQLATTGVNPGKREQLVRERIRLHIGAKETAKLADNIPRWAREHDPPSIDALWEASHPDRWRGTPRASKRRLWTFIDLLNQDITPPRRQAGDPAGDDLADGDRVIVDGREHTARMVSSGWVVLDDDRRVPRSSVVRLRVQAVTA